MQTFPERRAKDHFEPPYTGLRPFPRQVMLLYLEDLTAAEISGNWPVSLFRRSAHPLTQGTARRAYRVQEKRA
jgi:hypothetical protein